MFCIKVSEITVNLTKENNIVSIILYWFSLIDFNNGCYISYCHYFIDHVINLEDYLWNSYYYIFSTKSSNRKTSVCGTKRVRKNCKILPTCLALLANDTVWYWLLINYFNMSPLFHYYCVSLFPNENYLFI